MRDGDGPLQRSWSALVRLAHAVERAVDAVRRRWGRPFVRGPRVVEPYLGYGDRRKVRVRGRVLADRGLRPAQAGDTRLAKLWSAVRRFDSAEVPGAHVRVAVGPGADGDGPVPGETEAVADPEGHIDVIVELPEALPSGWATVRFVLLHPAPKAGDPGTFRSAALVASRDAPYGVISDIDDTVLITGATRPREMLARTLLQNAHDRLPFRGVPELYGAFVAAGAPLFYVSSSPWNLFGPLEAFLELSGCPRGPLALRDWGLGAEVGGARGHHRHKMREIDAILATYPWLPFVLIGDAGQADPEIYAELARDRPERVAGVIVRNEEGAARSDEVTALADRISADGVRFAVVADSAEAARVAEAEGWITADGRIATEHACRREGGDDRRDGGVGDAFPPTDDVPDRV